MLFRSVVPALLEGSPQFRVVLVAVEHFEMPYFSQMPAGIVGAFLFGCSHARILHQKTASKNVNCIKAAAALRIF
jgi:hypothetical protein